MNRVIVLATSLTAVLALPLRTMLPASPRSAAPSSFAGNCRMSLWLKSVNPTTYEIQCTGSCEHTSDICDLKSQLIGSTHYYYCKCTQEGTPVEPDSTDCTTVVTETAGVWSHYCYNQFCETYCDSYAARWEPTTPCLCH